MRLAGIATFLYSLLVYAGGVIAYRQDGRLFFPILAALMGTVTLAASLFIYRSRMPASFVACATAMMLGLFFGYRFISNETFLPGGLLLTASFGVLFCLIAGIFAKLQE